jgi:hypothetical protein
MSGGLYEEMPAGDGKAPVQPSPMGARSSSGRIAPVVAAPSYGYRGTIGTGVSSSTTGGNVKTAQSVSSSRKPSSGLQPTLIGPLGYDDLK